MTGEPLVPPGEKVFFRPKKTLEVAWLFGAGGFILLLRQFASPRVGLLGILGLFVAGAILAVAPEAWVTERRVVVRTWWSSRSEPIERVASVDVEGLPFLRRVRVDLRDGGVVTLWVPFRARKAAAALREACAGVARGPSGAVSPGN